ncbi:hypothetical protein B0A55_10891 [Friedmanniomyces simplex]|uniref:Uncharacterized protein n=1 Tax=Friedmanniomyces simplex TaxID=329884 RepID=A0A4U0WWW7_9PEZI|nr:hypothetical protein B0A55_10891 [Friedmanniomyces simplex]
MLNLISLALLLPTALALPFNWSFFKGNPHEQPAPQFDVPHRHQHWTYTLTATSEAAFPTALTGYAYAASTGTGTGTAVVEPTATGYNKRDLAERHFPHSFPTAFPTAANAFPTPGTSYPTAYPSRTPAHDHHHDEHHEELEHVVGTGKRLFDGPRRHPVGGLGSFHWTVSSATETSALVAPTAAAASASSGYAVPTGTAAGVPTYGL